MTPFYVRVTLPCGARGLYFERRKCVETATELRAFRNLEWPEVRQRLQRQGLAYRVFVSPRAAPVLRCVVGATATPDHDPPRQLATQPGCEQRVLSWGR
jgi:hypothetical protein